MVKHEFIYSSVTESETKMLESLYELLHEQNVSERDQYCFILSVSEAFTNALIHGNHRDPSKKIMLRIVVNEEELFADIVDQGAGGLSRIDIKKEVDLLSEGGRGIGLINHYASDVDFSETTKGGLKVAIRYERNQENKVNSY